MWVPNALVDVASNICLALLGGLLADVLTDPGNPPAVLFVVFFIKLWPPVHLAKAGTS